MRAREEGDAYLKLGLEVEDLLLAAFEFGCAVLFLRLHLLLLLLHRRQLRLDAYTY